MASTGQVVTEGVALQAYVSLAKNSKGKSVVAAIQQALSASNVFVFSELLELPSVQALAGTEDAKYLELLKIFAYGTYADYKNAKTSLPSLSPLQVKKLQQLTIVTLAAANKVIPYTVLQQQLDMPVGLRELEDLIIDAIYQGIVQGKLDQKSQQFEVESAMGRDLKPETLDSMIEVLANWSVQSESLLKSIKEKILQANIVGENEKKHKEEFDKRIETVKANIKLAMESELMQTSEGFGEDFGFDRRGGRGKMKGHKDHPQRDRKG